MENYIERKYKLNKIRNFSYDFQKYPKLTHILNQHRLRKINSISIISKFNIVKLKIMNELEKKFYQKNLLKELKDPKNIEIKSEIGVNYYSYLITKSLNYITIINYIAINKYQ